MAEFMGEYEGSREPRWEGTQRETEFLVSTLAEAQDLVDSLNYGGIDPYLYVTWTEFIIERARDERGRFTGGWVVSVSYTVPEGYPEDFADALNDAYGD